MGNKTAAASKFSNQKFDVLSEVLRSRSSLCGTYYKEHFGWLGKKKK
jgi:hypothetical protein